MIQYCRYCINATYIDDDSYECGAFGAVYPKKKSRYYNRCKKFEFVSNDLWRFDEKFNFKQYRPRKRKEDDFIQLEVPGWQEEV